MVVVILVVPVVGEQHGQWKEGFGCMTVQSTTTTVRGIATFLNILDSGIDGARNGILLVMIVTYRHGVNTYIYDICNNRKCRPPITDHRSMRSKKFKF